MNNFIGRVENECVKSIPRLIVFLFNHLKKRAVHCLYIVAIGLCLCIPNVLYAQGAADLNGDTAVTAGSIRQRELLAFKNEEIVRLRKELIAVEARLKQLRSELQSQNSLTNVREQGLSSGSPSSSESSSSMVSGQREYIALGKRWFVQLSSSGPDYYLDLMKARAIQNRLPSESDCQTFSKAFEKNPGLAEKLTINGFPVTNFWALRSNGTMGFCRVSRVSSQRYRAAISSTTPSRSDKAIALVSK